MKDKIKIVGNILVLISLGFILKTVVNMEINWWKLINNHFIKIFIGSVCFQSIIVFFSCVPWFLLLSSLVGKIKSVKHVWYIFLKSNIYKYLPGNFLHYVGRNQLAVEYSVSHIDLALATGMDVIIGLGTGICFASLFFFERVLKILDESIISLATIVICIFVLCGFFCVKKIKYTKELYEKYMMKIKRLKTIKAIIGGVGYYFMQNTLTVLMVVFVCGICIPTSSIKEKFSIGTSYIFASVIGTIMPGAPAGVGIREAIMININSGYAADDMLVLSVIMRLISIMGDFFAYMCCAVVQCIKRGEGNDKKVIS